MLKPFWLRCESCEHEWASDFDTENGMLVAAYHSGEHCPECESNAVEVVNECEVD
jgi:Zn finger protein HypA/HybF involved in hydrogenase expression